MIVSMLSRRGGPAGTPVNAPVPPSLAGAPCPQVVEAGPSNAAANRAGPPSGPGLLDRWPLPAAHAAVAPPRLDLASRDLLGLLADTGVIATAAALAAQAVRDQQNDGPGAAPALQARLEAGLAALLDLAHVAVRPDWAAGAAIRALVGPGDHVLVDNGAGPAFARAAEATGADVHRFPHASVASVARWLEAIRANSPRAGILVATESLPARGGEGPDLAALQTLARRHGATLLVQLGCDLGTMGTGGGLPDVQGLRGALDVVTGDLRALGGAQGGFAASAHPGLRAALAGSGGTDAALLPPVQSALACAALLTLAGPEGARRRDRLLVNSCALALGLRAAGFAVSGAGTPVLHVALGTPEMGRRMTGRLAAQGIAVELVEGPGGDGAGSRWRLRVRAGLGREGIDAVVALAREAAACSDEAEDAEAGVLV